MAATSIFLPNKYGFCKHTKKHVEKICNEEECNVDECEKGHPRGCRYFRTYKRCKFGDYCAFDHSIPIDPVLEELDF